MHLHDLQLVFSWQPTKPEPTCRACGKATQVRALLFGGTKCRGEIHLKLILVPSFLSVPGQLRVLGRQSIMAGNLQWGSAHLPAAPQQGEASRTRCTPFQGVLPLIHLSARLSQPLPAMPPNHKPK